MWQNDHLWRLDATNGSDIFLHPSFLDAPPVPTNIDHGEKLINLGEKEKNYIKNIFQSLPRPSNSHHYCSLYCMKLMNAWHIFGNITPQIKDVCTKNLKCGFSIPRQPQYVFLPLKSETGSTSKRIWPRYIGGGESNYSKPLLLISAGGNASYPWMISNFHSTQIYYCRLFTNYPFNIIQLQLLI